jgi:hypothetical protein
VLRIAKAVTKRTRCDVSTDLLCGKELATHPNKPCRCNLSDAGKYFTPERYLQLGNLDDERAFLAAQQQWEEAISGYREHLQRIRKQLPRGLQRLVESVYLHDARVLNMHQNQERFVITLQPESDPARLVVLGYTLVEEPIIEQQLLPADRRSVPVEWLYDELDLDRPEGPRGLPVSANKPTFRHNILLSNGWEVTI